MSRWAHHRVAVLLGGGRSSAVVEAPEIEYGSSDVTWSHLVTEVDLEPANTGGAVTSWSVDPALPAGVTLNTSTGAITGTPTSVTNDDTYTITATGPGGEDTFDITAEVLPSLLTDLVAYWNLDEASGDRADSHTGGLDLTDNNTVGSGLGVDGSSVAADFVAANTEYLSLADNAATEVNDASWTLAGWIRKETGTNAYLGRDYNAPNSYWAVDSGGNMGWAMKNATTAASFPNSFSADTWRFVEFGYDAGAGVIFKTVNGGTRVTAALDPGPGNGSTAFALGRANGWGYFDGQMQCFGMWNRLLSADDRTKLINGSAAAIAYDDIAGLY